MRTKWSAFHEEGYDKHKLRYQIIE